MSETDEIVNCNDCGSPMDISIFAPFSNVVCPQCGEESRVKCELDQYVLKRRQGEGGMSLVFAAEDKNLGREVAIKILNEDYSSDDSRIEQFEQEAKLTAGISHPHVVRVYTVGKAFHRYYIAMELISGKSLEQMMSGQEALPEETIIPLMKQVTEGLHAAYGVNLIHRDIKPGNILVDHLGKAKIVDFGLALVTQGGVAIAEEIWATPYYVPPEALGGQPEDFRSDVYALCASMYHALAGQPPFTTETRSTSDLREIKKNLPPLKRVAPWLSDSICSVIDKGMQFDPSDRYSSYEELLFAVQFAEDNIGVEGAALPEHLSTPVAAESGSTLVKIGVPVAMAVVVLGVGGFFLVKSIVASQAQNVTSPTTTTTDQDSPDTVKIDTKLRDQVSKGYQNALKQVQNRQFLQAGQALEQTMLIEKHPEPSATLAGLHGVTVRLLAGTPRIARNSVSKVVAHVQKSDYDERSSVPQKQVLGLCEAIASRRSAKLLEVPESKEMSALSLLIVGLKNAEMGVWDVATEQLQQFVDLDIKEIPKHKGYFEVYQKEAQRYLNDIAALEKHRGSLAKKFGAKQEVLDLKQDLESLKFQSNLRRSRWLVKHFQKNYNDWVDRFVSTEKQQQEQVITPEKMFVELKMEVAVDIEERRFEAAIKTLSAENLTVKSDEEKRLHLLYLCNQADSYYKAYASEFASRELRKKVRKHGEEGTLSILKTQKDGFIVRTPEGNKLLKFSEVDPASMLSFHGELTSGLEEFQKQSLLENAICYAYLSGEREKAQKAAEQLADKNEVFSIRWRLCLKALEGE